MTTPRQHTDAYPAQPNADQYPPQQQGDDAYPAHPGAEAYPTQQGADPYAGQQGNDPYSGRQDSPIEPQAAGFSDTTARTDPSAQQHDRSTSATASEAPTGDALFADNDLSELRARWNDVQAAFVDDPRACVQKADSLVSSAVDQLTANFSHTRAQLEEQWSRGEEASTEDLRVALKRYRDFFDRLLSV
ncbi:hypothetical protein MMUR_27700 [Mycolicibacterium murale]|uniref:Uncharacterized protein n=1 Tax=Mycolicibacterium murale TaxID=182220 RepID=A0A7I9WLS6_9MYCO|nr:hypothetical protein [Mycolicibacterium murale]MCV7181229.1 hypothetical protein [Mycolicibacterium murale]GFG58634.1 hypothetical protein MMUR_27700 [Mycolicibacterium murale]